MATRVFNFASSSLLVEKLKKYFPKMENTEADVEQAMIKILKNHPKEFGANLKKIRESKDISQIGLSNHLGISQASYSAWETGNHVPRLSKLELLSQLLDVDVGDLFPESQERHEKNLIPIYRGIDFFAKTLSSFKTTKPSLSQAKTEDFYNYEYQFAYVMEDDSMQGENGILPKNSLIFCSNNELSADADKFKQMLSLSGKVVLLSFANGPALLREITFDGTYIRIKAWNSNIPEKICLSSGTQALPEGKESSALYNNHPLTVSMIEVFGIARKQIQDLK